METKKCSKCGEIKTIDQFKASASGGARYWCKSCIREYNQPYYDKHNAKKSAELKTNYKTCVKCGSLVTPGKMHDEFLCKKCKAQMTSTGARIKRDTQQKVLGLYTHKKCAHCGKYFHRSEFLKKKGCPDGLDYICPSCHRTKNKINSENNKIKNKDKVVDINSVKKCPRCGEIKKLSEFNFDKSKSSGVATYCKPCQYTVIKTSVDNSINLQLRKRLSRRITIAIKRQYSIKSISTIELLACTIEHARQHIENQFKPGMTWCNHGNRGWHIDHIIPCESFDLRDPEQQRKCFHYTNLQPLWWHENLSKGCKIVVNE